MGGIASNKPIVGMAASYTANGPSGYWQWPPTAGSSTTDSAVLRVAEGGVPTADRRYGAHARRRWLLDGGGRRRHVQFGDAQFYGSVGATPEQAVVGMAPTPDGGGYWLVAADGGIFSYGDALFHGSAGNLPLVQPMVGMAAMPDGGGYWFSAADGGLFNYGNAPFYGSGTGLGLGEVVGHGHRRRTHAPGVRRRSGHPTPPGTAGRGQRRMVPHPVRGATSPGPEADLSPCSPESLGHGDPRCRVQGLLPELSTVLFMV